MSDLVKHTSDATFEQDVLQSTTPVLVDFWAEWCSPCKAIAPVLDSLAKTKEGEVSIVKLNIDENPETPVKYGVRAIPTLILFKNGQLEATKVGAVTQTVLEEFLNEHA